jgi:hypothetical protein
MFERFEFQMIFFIRDRAPSQEAIGNRGQRTEDRRQRTEDRGQRTEGRGQKIEGRGQRIDNRLQMNYGRRPNKIYHGWTRKLTGV